MGARKFPTQRVEELFEKANLEKNQRAELLSLVCSLHCEGKTVEVITKELRQKSPKFAKLMSREDPWTLIRAAANKGLLTYQAPITEKLANVLADEYDWEANCINVVHSPVLEHVAREAAERLLEHIQHFKTFGQKETVHIGFAGGRLLRQVAKELAQLLRVPAKRNPGKIVFHAMVAAFGDDDFEADPNNFITYFIQEPLAVDIGFVSMAAPGIVETELRSELRKYREINEVYQAAAKLNIIVSSGGDWKDEHSTAQAYLKEIDEGDVQALNKVPAIGDLLWQPMCEEGPIDMDSGEFKFRPNTLVNLQDLPTCIQERGVHVMLALGPCGKCGKPKGNLLHTIMNYRPQLVTDIVTNSPTVYDALKTARKKATNQPPPESPQKPR